METPDPSASNTFCYSAEVEHALKHGDPIVALESTLIAHSFPKPERKPVAQEIEDTVRRAGAVPATIAVLDGKVHVGLDPDTLTRLTEAEGVWKVSVDNVPLCLAAHAIGATTVASSIHLAAQARIKVFATGGIGGVHRGAQETFDVSADLKVLADQSMVVVCAGAKSILDLPATLEVLETAGVTVGTLETDQFPGFYVRDSGLRTAAIESPKQAAAVFLARRGVGLRGSLLLAFQPPEATAIDRAEHDAALHQAESEAAAAGITGRDLSPLMLKRLSDLTDGRARQAGRAIILASARIAAEVAAAVAAS